MSDAIRAFYDRLAEGEWARFERPMGMLEFATAKHLIGKYFSGQGLACDIGAGPGRYSELLASLGH